MSAEPERVAVTQTVAGKGRKAALIVTNEDLRVL